MLLHSKMLTMPQVITSMQCFLHRNCIQNTKEGEKAHILSKFNLRVLKGETGRQLNLLLHHGIHGFNISSAIKQYFSTAKFKVKLCLIPHKDCIHHTKQQWKSLKDTILKLHFPSNSIRRKNIKTLMITSRPF